MTTSTDTVDLPHTCENGWHIIPAFKSLRLLAGFGGTSDDPTFRLMKTTKMYLICVRCGAQLERADGSDWERTEPLVEKSVVEI